MMVKFIMGLFLLIFLPGMSISFVKYLKDFVNFDNLFNYFIIGSILGIIVDQIIFRKIKGFEVFEHELTHAISALLFFRKITSFKVIRDEGGYVTHQGNFGGQFGDIFIGLAPYFFPIFTFFSVLFYPMILKNNNSIIQGFWLWIGFTFGYHLWSTLRETKNNFHLNSFKRAGTNKMTKSDIGRRGLIFSSIFIISLTILFHTFIMIILIKGYSEIPIWLRNIWDFTLQKGAFIYDQYLRNIINSK